MTENQLQQANVLHDQLLRMNRGVTAARDMVDGHHLPMSVIVAGMHNVDLDQASDVARQKIANAIYQALADEMLELERKFAEL